jgi:cyclic-di-GMP-binding protein
VADPSFDVVSKVDRQEVDNALNQAAKELGTRFDFRGTGTEVSWAGEEAIAFQSETEERCRAAIEVYKVTGTLVQGITSEKAKEIAKKVRDEGPKGVQAQIQGDQLRISGKKKDHLQEIISLLKGSDFGIALQFTNYR